MHPSRLTAIVIVVLTFAGAMLSSDPIVVMVGGAVLAIGLLVLWTPNNVPVLLLPFLLQWIPVALKPMETVFTSKSMSDLTDIGGDLSGTAIFAFVALLCMAVGLKISQSGVGRDIGARMSRDAASWSQPGMIKLSLALIAIGHVIGMGFGRFGGFNEVMSTLSSITYCGLFMLLYWSLRTKQARNLALLVFLAEIVMGMSGFFGEFRTTLFVAALALICSQQRLGFRSIIAASTLSAIALVVMVFWSNVKPEYRDYMTQGIQQQASSRPLSERLQFLWEAVQRFDSEKFDDGFTALVARASYIDFLSATRDYVPASTPFEGGARTLAGVNHVFTPRILFPSKPPLESDTVVTAKYTGLAFTNYTFASISIGYLGELYIDFGTAGACVAIAVLGLGLGLACRSIMTYRPTPMILNVGLAVLLTFPLCYFEQALVKVMGAIVMSLLLCLILQRFVFGTMLTGLIAQFHLPAGTSRNAVPSNS